jgi:hypothetical protein
MSYNWLDRKVAHNGPHMTLVRNEKDFLSAMRHCKVKNPEPWLVTAQSNGATHWLQHPTDGLCAIVTISVKKQTKIEVYGILVHEAVHVAQAYFEHIGEHTPAKEQQAYAVQNISQILIAEYKRQTRHKRKKVAK